MIMQKKTFGYNTATEFYELQKKMIKFRLENKDLDKIDRNVELSKIKRK